jgi:hypothetical protein
MMVANSHDFVLFAFNCTAICCIFDLECMLAITFKSTFNYDCLTILIESICHGTIPIPNSDGNFSRVTTFLYQGIKAASSLSSAGTASQTNGQRSQYGTFSTYEDVLLQKVWCTSIASGYKINAMDEVHNQMLMTHEIFDFYSFYCSRMKIRRIRINQSTLVHLSES